MKFVRSSTQQWQLAPVLAFALLLAACSSHPNDTAQLPSGDTSSSAVSAVAEETVESAYADGTYDATGEYRSPAGSETVQVSLTLKDGMIADAAFQGDATNKRSIAMQNQFAAGFKEQVVGKSIDSLSLGAVNGSSLTPKGFMDAVEKIKAEAASS